MCRGDTGPFNPIRTNMYIKYLIVFRGSLQKKITGNRLCFFARPLKTKPLKDLLFSCGKTGNRTKHSLFLAKTQIFPVIISKGIIYWSGQLENMALIYYKQHILQKIQIYGGRGGICAPSSPLWTNIHYKLRDQAKGYQYFTISDIFFYFNITIQSTE